MLSILEGMGGAFTPPTQTTHYQSAQQLQQNHSPAPPQPQQVIFRPMNYYTPPQQKKNFLPSAPMAAKLGGGALALGGLALGFKNYKDNEWNSVGENIGRDIDTIGTMAGVVDPRYKDNPLYKPFNDKMSEVAKNAYNEERNRSFTSWLMGPNNGDVKRNVNSKVLNAFAKEMPSELAAVGTPQGNGQVSGGGGNVLGTPGQQDNNGNIAAPTINMPQITPNNPLPLAVSQIPIKNNPHSSSPTINEKPLPSIPNQSKLPGGLNQDHPVHGIRGPVSGQIPAICPGETCPILGGGGK